MYLLVNVSEFSDLMELSYSCSMGSIKNKETWFDQSKWEAGVKRLLGEELYSQFPKGPVEVVIFRSGDPPCRLCETLPPDPVSDAVKGMMKTLRLLEPRDFFRELSATWP
jgi:hypothetical protein